MLSKEPHQTATGPDLWDGGDVPLAEEQERYVVRVRKDGAVVSEQEVNAPQAAVTPPAAPFDIEVGQISARWGVGAIAKVTRHD